MLYKSLKIKKTHIWDITTNVKISVKLFLLLIIYP